jgi:UDP-N-acetylglucosamine 1-carboxyvinyltransferase
MQKIIQINGPTKLEGHIKISGAKNAILPIAIAALTCKEPVTLSNVPNILDVDTTIEIFKILNVKVIRDLENELLYIDSQGIQKVELLEDLVSKKRSSIWLLAPLLIRLKEIKICYPGGCKIGDRKIDLHIKVLEAMGAKIVVTNKYILATCPTNLHSTNFHFEKTSVGATITAIIAACYAEGKSIISGCAREPEVVDTCKFLISMGCKISGLGTKTLTIEGIKFAHSTNYRIISDRIETGTYIIAAGITNGNLTLSNVSYSFIKPSISYFESVGIKIEKLNSNQIKVYRNKKILPADIETKPYPGFATDLQSQFMSLMCIANGTSIIKENIYNDRIAMHAKELRKLGANILTANHIATIKGVPMKTLRGSANLHAHNLRSGAGLVLAAMVSSGTSTIFNSQVISRGYHDIASKLKSCNAKIKEITCIPINESMSSNEMQRSFGKSNISHNLIRTFSEQNIY